jgi:hypothetical protein
MRIFGLFAKYNQNDQDKEDETVTECSTHGEDKCIPRFDGKVRRK